MNVVNVVSCHLFHCLGYSSYQWFPQLLDSVKALQEGDQNRSSERTELLVHYTPTECKTWPFSDDSWSAFEEWRIATFSGSCSRGTVTYCSCLRSSNWSSCFCSSFSGASHNALVTLLRTERSFCSWVLGDDDCLALWYEFLGWDLCDFE